MDDDDDAFQWGDRGKQYWLDLGAQCKATPQQIKFACSRFQGASATAASRLAGVVGSPAKLRQSGHRTVRSTAVLAMLALAEAEGKPKAEPGVLDKAARIQLLSDIARKSPDKTLQIWSVEALNKMDSDAAERSETHDTDGFNEWRDVREFLHQTPGGALALIHLWTGTGQTLANLPLLRDVHQQVMAADPATWDKIAKGYPLTEQLWLKRRLDDPLWQIEARVKLWREVGIEIDHPPGLDLSFTEGGERPAKFRLLGIKPSDHRPNKGELN